MVYFCTFLQTHDITQKQPNGLTFSNTELTVIDVRFNNAHLAFVKLTGISITFSNCTLNYHMFITKFSHSLPLYPHNTVHAQPINTQNITKKQ